MQLGLALALVDLYGAVDETSQHDYNPLFRLAALSVVSSTFSSHGLKAPVSVSSSPSFPSSHLMFFFPLILLLVLVHFLPLSHFLPLFSQESERAAEERLCTRAKRESQRMTVSRTTRHVAEGGQSTPAAVLKLLMMLHLPNMGVVWNPAVCPSEWPSFAPP